MSFIAGLVWVLAGCSSENMIIGSYDEVTGKTSTTVYSKYYDNGAWLLKDKLGIVVRVDQEKKTLPIVHGVAQPLRARKPGDSSVSGKVSFELWNFDSVPHQVKFKRMLVKGGELDFQNQVITAAAHEQPEAESGQVPILSYGTSIHVTLEIEVAGKPQRLELDLPRRTKKQMKQFLSKGAVRPYPWGGRSVKG